MGVGRYSPAKEYMSETTSANCAANSTIWCSSNGAAAPIPPAATPDCVTPASSTATNSSTMSAIIPVNAATDT